MPNNLRRDKLPLSQFIDLKSLQNNPDGLMVQDIRIVAERSLDHKHSGWFKLRCCVYECMDIRILATKPFPGYFAKDGWDSLIDIFESGGYLSNLGKFGNDTLLLFKVAFGIDVPPTLKSSAKIVQHYFKPAVEAHFRNLTYIDIQTQTNNVDIETSTNAYEPYVPPQKTM